MAPRSLRLYRQFYLTYPQIWQTVSAESLSSLFPEAIWQSLSAKSGTGTLSGIVGTVSPKLQTPPDRLIKSLSFSHFAELIAIEDSFKRTFYEIECIHGNWSVRELKRQIASLYYERSGLSKNKKKLAGMDNQLFVSKYQLELPKKEEMQRFLAEQIREVVPDSRHIT